MAKKKAKKKSTKRSAFSVEQVYCVSFGGQPGGCFSTRKRAMAEAQKIAKRVKADARRRAAELTRELKQLQKLR